MPKYVSKYKGLKIIFKKKMKKRDIAGNVIVDEGDKIVFNNGVYFIADPDPKDSNAEEINKKINFLNNYAKRWPNVLTRVDEAERAVTTLQEIIDKINKAKGDDVITISKDEMRKIKRTKSIKVNHSEGKQGVKGVIG